MGTQVFGQSGFDLPCGRNFAPLDCERSAWNTLRNHSAGTAEVLSTDRCASASELRSGRSLAGATYRALERALQAGLPRGRGASGARGGPRPGEVASPWL